MVSRRFFSRPLFLAQFRVQTFEESRDQTHETKSINYLSSARRLSGDLKSQIIILQLFYLVNTQIFEDSRFDSSESTLNRTFNETFGQLSDVG